MSFFKKQIATITIFIIRDNEGGYPRLLGIDANKIYSEKEFYLNLPKFFVSYLFKIIWNLDTENKEDVFTLIKDIVEKIKNDRGEALDILTLTDKLNPVVLRYTDKKITFDEVNFVFSGNFYMKNENVYIDTYFLKQENEQTVGHFSLMSAIILWQSLINLLNNPALNSSFREKSYQYIKNTVNELISYLDSQPVWDVSVLEHGLSIVNKNKNL